MAIDRKVGFAGATFVVAAAAGFVMQNGGALAERFGGSPAPQPVAVAVKATAEVPRGPALIAPDVEQTNVILSQAKDAAILARNAVPLVVSEAAQGLPEQPAAPGSYRVAALGDGPVMSNPEVLGDRAVPKAQNSEDCSVALSALPENGAMVHLYLDAPCNRDDRVTIQQGALIFTALTDDDGLYDVSVPALTTAPSFFALFADESGAKAVAEVSDAKNYERVALSWQGDAGLQVHAREFGADYGQSGHVWAQAPRTAAMAIRAQGGYLISLGDSRALNPQMAEVYTFPSASVQKSGAVRLSVEAEITAANCGREVQGLSLQTGSGDRLSMTELTLSIPECDAVGDFLVLNSLLRDLKVARN